MNEKLAYRYKSRRTGQQWSRWFDGRTKAEMLRDTKAAKPFIVQVVRLHPDGSGGNQLWQWKKTTGWVDVTGQRNWYADNCDPTVDHVAEEARLEREIYGDPLDKPLTDEEFQAYVHSREYVERWRARGLNIPDSEIWEDGKPPQKKNKIRFSELEDISWAFKLHDIAEEARLTMEHFDDPSWEYDEFSVPYKF